jgi:glutamate-1-semialdehyde 2,1-aminomutase
LAGADVCLDELSRNDGEALKRANHLGSELMKGIRESAKSRGIPLQVTGFGTAFYLHFTEREELTDYRDTFDDDRERLQQFLGAALRQGVQMVPDGRMYVSTAHTAVDIEETRQKLDCAFQVLT